MVFEIEQFYIRHVNQRADLFKSWEEIKKHPRSVEIFHVVVGKPFVVYESLAGEIGGFDPMIAKAVILSYGSMAVLLDLMKAYEQIHTSGEDLAHIEQMRTKIREQVNQTLAFMVLACKALSALSGTDFATLVIAKETAPLPCAS